MIEFKITKATDLSLIGVHRFHYPRLILGSSKKSHLPIPLENFPKKAILLFHQDQKIFIKNLDLEFYHVNDKKYSGVKNIAPNDSLRLGTLEMDIINYTPIQESETQEKEAVYKNKSDYHQLLNALENELIALDYQDHD